MKTFTKKISAMILFIAGNIAMCYGQTTVQIISVLDSLNNNNCPPPGDALVSVYGAATGYLVNDSISVYINFGDSFDTTIVSPISSNTFGAWTPHDYFFAGNFSVQCIATGPDGNADTLNLLNQITIYDTCGNVNGTVYVDNNGNCTLDAGETRIPFFPVTLLTGSNPIATVNTNVLGRYYFSTPNGQPYTIRIGSPANYSYADVCPVSGLYNITSPSSNNNFGLTCNSGIDLFGLLNTGTFRPGFQSSIYVHVLNNNCPTGSAVVKLVLDTLVSFVSSNPAPASISGDTIIWNASNLTSTSYYNWWQSLTASVIVQTHTTAVIGDTVCFTLIVEAIPNDNNLTNNITTLCRPVVNSFDPNDKRVSPEGIGPQGYIAAFTDRPLTYTINFQNTGTADAYNIFVLDTLDSFLDEATFRVLASSHPMSVHYISPTIIKFNFNNIMLPDSNTNEPASHGYIIYTVKQKPNLADGTTIKNTAYIYFDFNTPIVTNTTLNTIEIDLSSELISNSQKPFILYPNPAATEVTLNFGKAARCTVQLWNTLGEMLEQTQTNSATLSLNISSYPKGIYFVTVTDDAGNKAVRKVVKM